MSTSFYPLVSRSYYQGQTVPTTYDAQSIAAEGTTQELEELDAAPPDVGSESPPSAMRSQLRLIRNVSATTATAGSLVKPGATGFYYKRSADMPSGAKDKCIGVVHHRLAGGIVQHDLGWIVTKGPCWINKITGALTAGGLVVATTTAGSCGAYANTGTSDQTGAMAGEFFAILGRVITDAASGDAQVHVMLFDQQ